MKKVLIVEDDKWLAEQWMTYCEANGFTAKIAKDGFTAIDMVDADNPAVIVLDILLPGPNGMAFLHELRSHSDLASVPVVVVTSCDIDGRNFLPYGVERVFNKDEVTPGDLVGALRMMTV